MPCLNMCFQYNKTVLSFPVTHHAILQQATVSVGNFFIVKCDAALAGVPDVMFVLRQLVLVWSSGKGSSTHVALMLVAQQRSFLVSFCWVYTINTLTVTSNKIFSPVTTSYSSYFMHAFKFKFRRLNYIMKSRRFVLRFFNNCSVCLGCSTNLIP